MVTSNRGTLNIVRKKADRSGVENLWYASPVFQYFWNQQYIKWWTNFKQKHTIYSLTRNMTCYWTAIESISMKVFKILETVVFKYGHKFLPMQLQTTQISSCAKSPGRGREIRVLCSSVCGWSQSLSTLFYRWDMVIIKQPCKPRNTSYWLADNPRIINAVLLNGVKVKVWSATSATRIIRPIFF